MPPQLHLDKQSQLHNTTYACPRCRVAAGENYRTILKAKYLRPLLIHVVGSLWQCPKCCTIYYDRDFAKQPKEPKRCCSHCGRQRFKYDARTGELICLECGLVVD